MLEIQVDHTHTVCVDLYQNSFIDRWKQLFVETVQSCSINQLESFACSVTESQAQQRLQEAIVTINNFLQRELIPTTPVWDSQKYYNELHSKFELLSGTYENPTRLMKYAPANVKSAIRDLNFYIHRLENRPYKLQDYWYISFDKGCYQRRPLLDEDYQHFSYQLDPGLVYIHYSELGKMFWHLFEDGLPITYSGLKNLHYYSAEISIHLGPSRQLGSAEYFDWAKTNNIDLSNKHVGTGILPIGVAREVDNVRDIAYTSHNITQLRINHGKTI
jgi:hypothetical protein